MGRVGSATAKEDRAQAIRLQFDEAGYCAAPELHMPWLTPRIRSEIEEGDGNEFSECEMGERRYVRFTRRRRLQ